mmetsp:Transcript_12507/g.17072  ORF Transcript_12507/g.17072 Transcript_12507/m.17072 type:complete len:302 (-) Transcript_12507:2587-3492(-)
MRHLIDQRLHGCLEVSRPETFVAVAEDSEADDDVWVGELRGNSGDVLAHKRDGAEAPRAGHAGVLGQGLGQIVGVQKTKPDSVDLGEHVGDEAAQPGVPAVQHLHADVVQVALDLCQGVGGSGGGVEEVVKQVGGAVVKRDGDAISLDPHHHPLGQDGFEVGVVEAGGDEDSVRRGLQQLGTETLLHGVIQLRQDCRCHSGVLERDSHALVPAVEDRVQEMIGDLPPQSLRADTVGEVQRLFEPKGPVQLRLQRVEDHVHLVQHECPRVHEVQDLTANPGLRMQRLGVHLTEPLFSGAPTE